jgi:hydroxypyruvate reductase
VIKGGGVSRAAGRSIGTYVISDVAGADPGVVASGPTIPHRVDPAAAEAILRRASIDVPREVQVAMTRSELPLPEPEVTVLADGFDAARGAASVAPDPVDIRPDWLDGDLAGCLTRFLEEAGEGVTIAVGEPVLEVDGPGRGGRNTHAALLAAELIESSEDIFTAFATDGVDGSSKSAGAIVDGQTTSRGGSPAPARAGFDSSGYLGKTSDLLKCAPTGTNVADIWILWRRGVDRNVE